MTKCLENKNNHKIRNLTAKTSTSLLKKYKNKTVLRELGGKQMPNWCKGNLKIRGKKENIIKFLKEGTSLLDGFWEPKEIKPEIEINDYDEIEIKNINKEKGIDCLYLNGTRRHFINPIENEIYIYDTAEEEQIICLENFKAAWRIDADSLREISAMYNIDIKIYGFERGMEFNQDIEIIKGKIIKDETIEFQNYQWECIEPNIGG